MDPLSVFRLLGSAALAYGASAIVKSIPEAAEIATSLEDDAHELVGLVVPSESLQGTEPTPAPAGPPVPTTTPPPPPATQPTSARRLGRRA